MVRIIEVGACGRRLTPGVAPEKPLLHKDEEFEDLEVLESRCFILHLHLCLQSPQETPWCSASPQSRAKRNFGVCVFHSTPNSLHSLPPHIEPTTPNPSPRQVCVTYSATPLPSNTHTTGDSDNQRQAVTAVTESQAVRLSQAVTIPGSDYPRQ